MARTSNSDGVKEKIGVASVSGHPVDISYIGGSMFEAEFTDIKSKPMQLDRSAMNKLISAGQVKLLSGPRYKEICDAILPDGSTKTHNADGTLKSQVNQMVGQLIEEGYVEGRKPAGNDQDQAPAPTSRGRGSKSAGGSAGPFTREGGENRASRPSPMDAQPVLDDMTDDAYDEPAFGDADDEFVDAPDSLQMRSNRSKQDGNRLEYKLRENEPMKRQPSRHAGDLNGDGIVDEMDAFVAEEQKKSPLVMIALVFSALASVGLFFVAFFVSSSLLGHDTNLRLPQPQEQQVQSQPQQEQASEGDQEQGQQGSEGDKIQRETVVRTDFDPETVVASFEMASEDKQKVAIAMFQAIRTNILNGDVNGFCQAIDIERIASEIAPAYAEYAAGIQNLGEAEKNELRDNYQATFSRNERQHVVDRDTYASVFGGRIREVRQDPGNPQCIYVVMEAITGDHQRVCFAINSDGANGWTVTDIMDPAGYVQMIAQGGELFQ